MIDQYLAEADNFLISFANVVADVVVRRIESKQTPAAEHPRLMLTAEQAARSLGIGRTHIYSLLRSGEIESVLIGRLRRVPVSSLEEYARGLPRGAA